jgi:MFS superfamily sulfate permease-like transporter
LSLARPPAPIPARVRDRHAGAIESLLCAIVADGMAQKHDSDEVFAQGAATRRAAFGGIAATARSRAPRRDPRGFAPPISALVHALGVRPRAVLASPRSWILPMASLAALL